MKRRDFIKATGLGGLAVSSAALAAPVVAPVVQPHKTYKWKMVTSWPKNFPGLGAGAEFLAKIINDLSDGQLQIKVYGAGEIVPAMEVFDAVSQGKVEMGHSASYYWRNKGAVNQFFTTIPFGLTAQEMNAWLYYGGGMDLWREAYEHHGLIPTAAGNTGVQMAGWFNREINDIQDLSGLKMRIPGFGANALTAAKGTVVTLAGGELFSALQSGAIDATEWVGPYNDLAFGLYKIAKYYYYPAWHEPGSTMECMINKKAYESLPKQLQNIVTYASRVANQDMLAEFTAKNGQALHTLVNEHRVDLRPLPFAVLKQMRQYVDEAIRNEAAKDPFTQKVYDSIEQFRQQVSAWHDVSERAYMNMRALINDSKKFDYCTPVVEEARPPTV